MRELSQFCIISKHNRIGDGTRGEGQSFLGVDSSGEGITHMPLPAPVTDSL